MAKAAIAIQNKDKRSMDYLYDFDSDDEDMGYEDSLIDTSRAQVAREAAVRFGREILVFKSKYQQNQCPVCARRHKEYENMKQEVLDRRADAVMEQELAIKQIQDSIDESMEDFMNQYFPNRDRLRLMDVVKMWKVVKKEMVKQKTVGALLEETGHWKVTNVHRIYYVTRC